MICSPKLDRTIEGVVKGRKFRGNRSGTAVLTTHRKSPPVTLRLGYCWLTQVKVSLEGARPARGCGEFLDMVCKSVYSRFALRPRRKNTGCISIAAYNRLLASAGPADDDAMSEDLYQRVSD